MQTVAKMVDNAVDREETSAAAREAAVEVVEGEAYRAMGLQSEGSIPNGPDRYACRTNPPRHTLHTVRPAKAYSAAHTYLYGAEFFTRGRPNRQWVCTTP